MISNKYNSDYKCKLVSHDKNVDVFRYLYNFKTFKFNFLNAKSSQLLKMSYYNIVDCATLTTFLVLMIPHQLS